MSDLERAREQKSLLYGRIKEAHEAYMNATDATERIRQRDRERVLRDMYKEACEEVRRLDPEQTAIAGRAGKNGKKPPSLMDSVAACGAVWADLEGTTWNQLQGVRWNDLPEKGSGRQMKQIQELVSGAMAMCTERQLQHMNAYYNEGLTLEEIGERDGVDVSTVSRNIKRGRQRVEKYVTAKLVLTKCVNGNGLFDYQLFLNSTSILTERQKEMVFLILTEETSYADIAEYLHRNPSTVWKTAERVEEKLGALQVQVDVQWSAIKPKRWFWAERSEKEVAEDLGLTPRFYYHVVCRGERVDGLPLLYCAILHRLAAGEDAAKAAEGLGCSKVLVKRVRRHYGDLPLPKFTEDYHPKEPRRTRVPDNPFVMMGSGEAVIDRIDAATYQKLQERFGGERRVGT